ncbi:lysylphosphatidylglycerol synthase transmembrane domain-containing protein [Bacteroides sedimenti]|uniref:TIGR00374 family protein n=1 Tax=Bacteroides sedimenti TaxID=2136147 RepID=A0ABM8IDK9_9BACE
MASNLKVFKTGYVLFPVIVGLAVVGWLFYKEINLELLSSLTFSGRMIFFIALAFLLMLGRDWGLMWRYRVMAEKKLSWIQAFNVNILCEFTSAVTPMAVGGSSLVALFLNKEGLNAGRSAAITISCLFLDELFFVLACALFFSIIPLQDLFGSSTALSTSVQVLFFLVNGVIAFWTFLLFIALFKRPDWVKKFLFTLFSLKMLRAKRKSVTRFTNSLESCSNELSRKPFSFWGKSFLATAFSWCCRYLVVNALLMAFTPMENHLIAFARQLILWILMAVSPTPGGSGLGEFMFKEYYSEFFAVSGVAVIVALLWRIITYYLYLIAGVCIIPQWVRKLG